MVQVHWVVRLLADFHRCRMLCHKACYKGSVFLTDHSHRIE